VNKSTLPSNITAEKNTLGAMILDAEAIQRARDILGKDAFFQPSHQAIYGAITRLADDSVTVDLTTLCDALEKSGELEKIGGPFYLADLAQSVVTSTGIEHHAGIVRDRYYERQLITACHKAIEQAMNHKPINTILSNLDSLAQAVQFADRKKDMVHIKDVLDQAVKKQIEKNVRIRDGKTAKELQTGIVFWDRLLGGHRKTELILLGGPPASGKSVLAGQILKAVSRTASAAMFPLEMSPAEISQRWLPMLQSEDLFRLNDVGRKVKTQEINAQVMRDAEALRSHHVWFDNSSNQTIRSIRGKARRLYRDISENNLPSLELIVIDYLQLLDSDGHNENERIDNATRGAKLIATELEVPVLLITSLSRSYTKDKRKPGLSDIRGSGAAEFHVDVAAFLHAVTRVEDDLENAPNTIELYTQKNRDFPCGRGVDLYLSNIGNKLQFVEAAGENATEPRQWQDDSEVPF
jgi:replicative DNA helicase